MNAAEKDQKFSDFRDRFLGEKAIVAPTEVEVAPPKKGAFSAAAARAKASEKVSVTSFAQALLKVANFGAPAQHSRRALLGDEGALQHLPEHVSYYASPATDLPAVLLVELTTAGGEALMGSNELLTLQLFHRQRPYNLMIDALDRFAADILQAFERKKGDLPRRDAHETVCVIAIRDSTVKVKVKDGANRESDGVLANHVMHFATVRPPGDGALFGEVSVEALESFTIEQANVARAGDRRDEYIERIYYRFFSKLDTITWREAFSREEERKRVRKVADAILKEKDTNTVRAAVESLFEEMAKNYGCRAKAGGKLVTCESLPPDHDLAPPRRGQAARTPGLLFSDGDERLLGYVIYCLDGADEAKRLREHLAKEDCFHNVLVFYRDDAKPAKAAKKATQAPTESALAVDLWQGASRMNGKLTRQGARFAGEAEVLSFLGRFFLLSRTDIATPKALAEALARRARYLHPIIARELAAEQQKKKADAGAESGEVLKLFDEFNAALGAFTPAKFASAYAETLAYGLLAARWLGKGREARFLRKEVADQLPNTSPFLRDIFRRLVELPIDEHFSWLLRDLVGLLDRTDVETVFESAKEKRLQEDPVIHFYEDFLNLYDPERRKREGVYYTPEEVVSCIVRGVHGLLVRDFGLADGLADVTTWGELAASKGFAVPEGVEATSPFVRVLDPATGTGTFLRVSIEVIYETFCARRTHLSPEAVTAEWCLFVREHLLPRLNGFEISVAPYIIAHLRLGFALQQTGFEFAASDRLHVYLTNTLELHDVLPLVKNDQNLAREGREADALKRTAPVTVIIGNPPYDRVSSTDHSVGGWVVHGNEVPGRDTGKSLFQDILEIANQHTIFSHVANLYNLYVYFWRWAVWKVFEANGKAPGVVAMITASSWLHGPGFMGLRAYARDFSDGIWTVDLGGDNKSAITESNIFGIETPVAITTLARRRVADKKPVRLYRRLKGSVEERLTAARAITVFPKVAEGVWQATPEGRLDSLRPETGDAEWTAMPRLIDLFPWQQPGCKYNRLWPIAPHESVLKERWDRFVSSSMKERPELFVTPPTGRSIETHVPGLPRLADLRRGATSRSIVRYGYRSFDRQWAFDDPRVAALERPALWQSLSAVQLFLAGMLTDKTGVGPALSVSTAVPDLHYFCGRGGKDIIPLYRDAAGQQPNVAKGLLAFLAKRLAMPAPTPEDLAAYCYALLSTPGYQKRFAEGLETPGLRVPLTADAGLWTKAGPFLPHHRDGVRSVESCPA